MDSIATLREQLMAAFSDEELRTLCFDHFQPVYKQFTDGMAKGRMVQLLLEECARRGELPRLLAIAHQVSH